MKAIKLINRNVIKYVDFPDIKDFGNNDVIVSTLYCGICGSDIHRISSPIEIIEKNNNRVLGHEAVGRIIKVGKAVNYAKIGDFVVINPILSCGNCQNCKKGFNQHCVNLKSIGKTEVGCFSSSFVIPESNLYVLKDIREKEKTLPFVLTDVFGVVIHAVNQAKNISSKDNIAIIGDGPIGVALAIYIGKKNRNVVLIGKNSYIRDFVTDSGIKYLGIGDLQNDKNEKYQYVFEAVGGDSGDILDVASSIVSVKGNIVVLGVYKENALIPIYLRRIFYKEIRLVGVNSYGNFGLDNDEFVAAIEFIRKNTEEVHKMITHLFHPSDCQKALETFVNKERSIKVVFDYTR